MSNAIYKLSRRRCMKTTKREKKNCPKSVDVGGEKIHILLENKILNKIHLRFGVCVWCAHNIL